MFLNYSNNWYHTVDLSKFDCPEVLLPNHKDVVPIVYSYRIQMFRQVATTKRHLLSVGNQDISLVLCTQVCQVSCLSNHVHDHTGLEIIFFQGGNGIISNRRYDEFYTKWKPVKNGIYECNYSNYGLWNYCGVLNFMPKCTHTLRFSLFMYIFSQKIITDSQSPSKTESIDMSFVYVWRKKNFRKIPMMSWMHLRQKISKHFLNSNIPTCMSLDVVFDGDHKFDVIFVEKYNKKSKI